jgi:hypothetical protein
MEQSANFVSGVNRLRGGLRIVCHVGKMPKLFSYLVRMSFSADSLF